MLSPILSAAALLASAAVPTPAPVPTAEIIVIAPAPDVVPLIEAPPAPPPPPARLPEAVRALIDAATASGDEAAVATIMRFARQTNPQTLGQIDALDAEFAARLAEKKAIAARQKADELANAAFLDLWKGEVEAGGSRLTGNNTGFGVYGSLKLAREGLRWRNEVSARVDYQRTNGETVTERGSAAWQPNYKVDERLYAYGLAQYEHDRFLGYDDRFTGGGGIGYRVLSSPTVKLDVEGGPAVRHTNFVEQGSATRLAGRASLGLRWAILPTLNFTQDAAAFIEEGNRNATATSTIDTKLIGSLKAKLSYNVTYEHGALAANQSTDTTTRATIVYGF